LKKLERKNTELKFHVQCLAVVNKASRLLGLIKKGFLRISADMFTSLYKSLVWPILEYGNLVYMGPHYKTDIHTLENIQQRAIKMVASSSHLNYEDMRRLQVLNLPTLHNRQHRGDMLAVYNMLHGGYNTDSLTSLLFHIIFTKLEGIHLSCINLIQEQIFR